MPFDYDAYEKKCNVMTAEQLQKEWENYTRQISAGATGTATSVLFMPYTAGLSVVGLAVSAPRIHNARKKRQIIEAGLQARGEVPRTRKRDVITAVGVSGAVSGLTMGIVAPGTVDVAASTAVQHGLDYVAGTAALGGSGAILVHTHDEYCRRKEEEEARRRHNSVDHLNLEGRLAASNVYHPTLHTSQTWPSDTASIADSVKVGPLATPFAAESSVLFRPSHSNAESNLAENANGPIELTEAQKELLERMAMLQLEMEKRGTEFPVSATGSGQGLSSTNHDQGTIPASQDNAQGLGIFGVDQTQEDPPETPQLSYHAGPLEEFYSPSPPQFSRPHLDARTESLPTKLSTHQEEPLPSYEQHCTTPSPSPQHHPVPVNLPHRSHTQDSGYYSSSSTPSLADSNPNPTLHLQGQDFISTQTYSPQHYASPSSLAKQPTNTNASGLHRHSHVHRKHRASEPAIHHPSMSNHTPSYPIPQPQPPPPPYTSPSPNAIVTPDKAQQDYFNSQATLSAATSSPVPSLAKKKSQAILNGVNQGWQWVKELPVPVDSKSKEMLEPDFGPPPEIPVAWKGI